MDKIGNLVTEFNDLKKMIAASNKEQVNVQKIEFMMDFGSVAVMINNSLN